MADSVDALCSMMRWYPDLELYDKLVQLIHTKTKQLFM